MTPVPYIRTRVFAWYQKHRRILPWRETRDPYRILVSEVMLQQTQVDRVLPKYHEFLQQFPSVRALANAKTADVITVWKGLGYNRRALFLQKTAQAVMAQHNGVFPKDITLLKRLPGIGEYTARAILAFAHGEAVAVLDTNHRRFYQRVFFGMRIKQDKDLLRHAETIVPKKHAYDWNQALMDFGSLVCLTRKPTCDACPIQKYCKAYPTIQISKKTKKRESKKPLTPFRETDRFFRGRLLDILREEGRTTAKKFQARYPELSNERLIRLVEGLSKDGLVVMQKEGILLP
jgi:A/G-specific adenine glycosylase